jgi:hypothetical protein
MEHVMDLYLSISRDSNCVNPESINKIIKAKVESKNMCLEDRWLMEIIKSFYNIGYGNGIKNNN